jgi:hypothetical protein
MKSAVKAISLPAPQQLLSLWQCVDAKEQLTMQQQEDIVTNFLATNNANHI